MKTFISISVILLIQLFIGCSTDSSTPTNVNTGIQTYFTLSFDVDNKSNGEKFIYIYFATSDVSAISTVTINSQKLDEFGVYGSLIQGWGEIDFASTINYSVSNNGKTTSGTITIPTEPTNVTCNNVTLNEDSDYSTRDTLQSANTYTFSWYCNDFDYFSTSYYGDNDRYSKDVTTTSVVYDIPVPDDFYISAVNGVLLIEGAIPNINGDYGKGYIQAISDSKHFYLASSGTNKALAKEANMISKEKEFIKNSRDFLMKKLNNAY